jgi:hypothetical protein
LTQGEIAIASAILTAGVVANVPASITMPPLNADGTITIDPATKAKDLYEWEVFRIFYNGVAQLPTDAKDWPVPAEPAKVPAGAPAANMPALLAFLQSIAAGNATNPAATATQLIGMIGGPAAAPAAAAAGIAAAALSPSAAAGS